MSATQSVTAKDSTKTQSDFAFSISNARITLTQIFYYVRIVSLLRAKCKRQAA